MINGLDTAGVNGKTINDAQAMANDQLLVDVVIIRAFDGYRDDEWYPAHRDQVKKATNPGGSVLWGTYGYLGYTARAGAYSWTAQRGDYQAQNMWHLISGGGIEWQIMPAVDIENLVYWENKVRQVVPLPDARTYADTYLMPWIDFVSAKIGRLPIVYTNPDKVIHYLVSLAGVGKYDTLFKCPLWLADYNPLVAGMPSYWEKVKPLFPNLIMHQFKPDVHDWPGVSDVDLNRLPGTRKQLKAWLADPAAPFPSEGGPDPDPEPDPKPEPADLAEVKARLLKVEARVEAHLAK